MMPQPSLTLQSIAFDVGRVEESDVASGYVPCT